MRSCAAMLSVQREFRRHCPAEACAVVEWMGQVCGDEGEHKASRSRNHALEVDMLPILDLSDAWTADG